MTIDQIIRCCGVVSLTAGLLSIAGALVYFARNYTRRMPSGTPGVMTPRVMSEAEAAKFKEETDKLIERVREAGKKRDEERMQRGGQPPENLMRPPVHVRNI